MPRGSKAKYGGQSKRKARRIGEGYEKRGASEERAARIAWATVNKATGGGRKGGSGRPGTTKGPMRRGGSIGGPKGGRVSAARPKAARSASARKGAQTRKRRAAAR